MMIYLSNINLNQNELQNAIVQPLASAPDNPKLGQIYTDSNTKRIKVYDGTNWILVGAIIEKSTNGKIKIDSVEMTVYELPIANATTLGGVKVGEGLTIDSEGKLSTDLGADLSNKADKVTNATNGNFAGLDSNGNLTDSGKKASDFDSAGAASAVQGSTTETVASVNAKVSKLQTNKVDKVTGKGLSTNDYTTAEKNKLAGISAGAEVNVQADWNVSDTNSDAYILHKPTKLSDFTNDENFIDHTVSNLANYYKKTETYTKSEIDSTIAGLALIDIVVPEDGKLPASGSKNKIYLIPKSSTQSSNSYDEYLWTGNAFEKIGDTEIDLSNYLTKTGNASKVTVTFTKASTRTNIATGEALDVITGKIAKYFGDLKSVAFSGSYNDLVNKPTLVKTQTATMTSVDGTQKVITVTGEKILNVVLTDSSTHEKLIADVSINGLTVTVKIAETYANGIDILVIYM